MLLFLLRFREVSGSNLVKLFAILTEIFRGFPPSLQADAKYFTHTSFQSTFIVIRCCIIASETEEILVK
jgi:hypothetical protein